ncbi:YolD-like protein [Bhargavaea ginsengi]|uniref:YolD-like protein n=1 Tax=Bhargavaea ginsengi TaxID=426757 RepID=A0A1H7BXN8_9BACL|nr:YolD-like family protein [Bhargavaea ginsengi]SEJ82413.1 YolD-like protein [Bhargavaea ginsengi]
MLRDRGNIKWTAMMLPEHLEALRQWHEEDNQIPRPELSEWDLMEIQEEIDLGYKRKCLVEVQTWRAGDIRKHTGVIVDVDVTGKRIRVDEGWLDVCEVVGVG